MDADPKPCKPNPMKDRSKIIKSISGFIQYWEKLCEEDITKHVRDTYEPLITYWDRIRSALMTLDGNIRTALIQGIWPQSRLTVVESKTMFFNNGDVREKFAMDEHYVGPTRIRPALSFRVGVNCQEGYMVLIQAADEEHPANLVGESIVFTQFCSN